MSSYWHEIREEQMQPNPFVKFTAIVEPHLPFTAEAGHSVARSEACLRIRTDCNGFFTARPSAQGPLGWSVRAVAASPALGCTEEEMQRAFDPPPQPHPIVQAVRNLPEQRKHWTGTAAELKDLLEPFGSCQSPSSTAHRLKSSMLILADHPVARSDGIELKFRHLHGKKRVIELREDPGGGDSENDPQSPPPDFEAQPQPTETEEVKAS
ncbi:hypothetical protein SBA4_440010 [Candidatus Sulfopaludibacter sp. SbA4]|nr:hypothetical protein SBA4_440010 [Candidatus Sulfopaludibacter sp. SbA4]